MMVKWHLVLILFLTSVLYASPSPQIYRKPEPTERCLTPDQDPGQCIVLEKCDSLLERLKNRVVTVNYLRRSACGFSGSSPKVCCPIPKLPEKTVQEIGIRTPDVKGNKSEDEVTKQSTTTEKSTTIGKPQEQITATKVSPTEPPVEDNVLSVEDVLPFECGISYNIFKIFGGTTSEPGAWPWLAAIQYKDDEGDPYFACGGVLVNEQFVLTAAHCITEEEGFRKVSMIRLGDHNLNSDDDGVVPQDFFPSGLLPHEKYSLRPQHYNDIALIKLDRKVNLTEFVSPICLPTESNPLTEDALKSESLTVAGWGSNGSLIRTDTLQEVQIKSVPLTECRKTFGRFGIRLRETQMCAGEKGKDSCRGDSGGPLMYTDLSTGRYRVAGIVSLGSVRCGLGLPGVYTVVSHYRDWIIETLISNMT